MDGKVYGGRKEENGGNLHQGDTFQTATEGGGRKGTIKIVGEVKFVAGYNLTSPPWGKNKHAGGLPATSQLDDWDESDAEQHSLQVKFNCCCEKPVLWGIIKVNDDPIVTVKP